MSKSFFKNSVSKVSICSIFFLILSANYSIAQNNVTPIVLPSAAETAASRALEKIDALEVQIRAMTDKIEKLEAKSDNLSNENSRLAKLLDEANAKIINLETGAKPKEIIAVNKTTPEPIIEKKEAIQEPVKIVEKTEEKKIEPPVILSSAQYLDDAKLAIQSNEFEKAIQNLSNLLKNHPNSEQTGDARWLLGETYFTRGEWLNAAKTYIDYLQKEKNGSRVSDVLVRLASSYRELGDNKQRCLALKSYKDRTKNPSAILKARADDEFAKGACP